MSEPVTPALDYVFTIEAEIAPPRSSGSGPMGERLHIPITGGRVYGDRLTGRILPGGSDWPLIGPDGHSRIEARYTIEVDDGTLIYVVNRGLRVSSGEVREKLRAGDAVAPDAYYLRGAPAFDAPDGPHAWLRESLFIGSIAPDANRVLIRVFRVT